jgi:hypothetical protein
MMAPAMPYTHKNLELYALKGIWKKGRDMGLYLYLVCSPGRNR